MQNDRTQHMLNAPVLSLLLKMASPNAVAFLVQAAVSMTEVWYVGQLGTISLAAMALMFPWLMLMQMLANGAFGGAITGAVARALGAGRQDEAERLIWHALCIALVAGLSFLVLVLVALEPLLSLMSDDPAVLAEARRYALILFSGCPLLWSMALLSSIFRGMGNMRFPAMLMVLGAAVQIPLSGTLILGWFGVPSMGISGAAVSVVLVALLSTSASLMALRRPQSPLQFRFAKPRLEPRLFGLIMKVALPSALSPLATVATISGTNVLAGAFGVAALAGYGIGSRIEFLVIPVVFGLGVAMNALVGVNLGAGQLQRAVRIGWVGGATAATITGTAGLLLAAFPDVWASIFSDDPETLASARSYLRYAAPFFALQGLGLSLFFASQGAGTVTWPVIATFLRLVVSLGLGALAVFVFDLPLYTVYLATGIGMLVYGLVTAASLKLGVWDKMSAPA